MVTNLNNYDATNCDNTLQASSDRADFKLVKMQS